MLCRSSSPRSMAGHSFHSRPFEERKCVAADRHARMARFDYRADEDHRSADQSHGAWRQRVGLFPPGDSVHTWLRVFGQTDHHRLGWPPYRTCLDRADEAPWIHEICSARRRLGAVITEQMGLQAPPELLGIHTTCLACFQPISTRQPSPERRRLPASQQKRKSLTSDCSLYTPRASPTDSNWGCARRRCTELRIPGRFGGLFS